VKGLKAAEVATAQCPLPSITGGIGWSGLAELQRFVESGGLLVTLGSGSMLPLEAGNARRVYFVSRLYFASTARSSACGRART
jgi:hypothetical protein